MSPRRRTRRHNVRIFVCYAHADPLRWKNSLEILLRWPGVEVVTIWSDKDIIVGSDPDKSIKAELATMDIFLPLITPYFAASQYIQTVEVPIARQRMKDDQVLVAPIVVSHPGKNECDWLMKLERLPHKIKTWAEICTECRVFDGGFDEALRLIRDGVKQLVDRVIAMKATRR